MNSHLPFPHSRLSRLWLLTLALLTGMTGFSGRSDFQFHSNTNLLDDSSFPSPVTSWKVHGDPNNVIFTADSIILQSASEVWSGATLKLPIVEKTDEAQQYLLLRGIFTRKNTDSNRENVNFDSATIVAIEFNTIDGKRLIVHVPLDITHAKVRTSLIDVIAIPESAGFLQFRLLKRAASDVTHVSQITLSQASKRPMYLLFGAILIGTWTLLLLFTARYLYRFLSPLTVVLVIVTTLAGTALLLDPRLPTLANQLWKNSSIIPALAFTRYVDVETIGHLIIFFGLGILGSWIGKRAQVSLWVSTGGLILIAIATELAQLHFSSRSANVADLFINFTGLFAALLLYMICNKKKNNKIKKQTGAA